jgi:hypothetical protein
MMSCHIGMEPLLSDSPLIPGDSPDAHCLVLIGFPRGCDDGRREQLDRRQRELCRAREPLSERRREGRERERRQVAPVDVGLEREEQVPGGPRRTSARRGCSSRRSGRSWTRRRRERSRAASGPRGKRTRRPAGFSARGSGCARGPSRRGTVVGEELLAVVGGARRQVELDEDVERELDRIDPDLEREVGLDLAEGLEFDIDDRLPVGTGISFSATG